MTYAMTQTKGLVASIGATAAFTALLTGGVVAANQAGAATSDSNGTGDTIIAPQNDPADSTATDQSSDHCKIPKGAVDELGTATPNPGDVGTVPSDHLSDFDFTQRYVDGALIVKPADVTNPNGRICEWKVDITTNATQHDTGGDELKDDVTLTSNSAYGKDPWLIVKGEKAQVKAHARVYYTPDQPTKANEVPADATLIGETDLTFNSADTQTASIAKPASLGNGYVTWVWSVEKNDQPTDWAKFLVASTTDGWAADNEVAQHPSVATPTPAPSETTPAPAPTPTTTETTPTPKPTPILPDRDGVTPPPAPVPTPEPTTDPTPAPAPSTGEVTPTPAPSETTPVTPTPEETTPAPNPSETTPAPVVPTPDETTPAPAPSTPGDASVTPAPTPSTDTTTETPLPGSHENGDKDGKGGATNGHSQGNNQTGTKAPVGSTSVDHQGATLAHTGSVTLPLLGGAALLLATGAGLALTKRRAVTSD